MTAAPTRWIAAVPAMLAFRRLVVTVLASGSAVSGCASMLTPTGTGYGGVEPAATIKDDPYSTTVDVLGPSRELTNAGSTLSLSAGSYLIRSFVTRKTGIVLHQLYVSHRYYGSEWIFWNRAQGEDAQVLDFNEISRDVGSCSAYGGCSHTETFGVILPDSVLRARPTGYSVKAYAQTGRSMVVNLYGAQIQAQLSAVDSIRSALGIGVVARTRALPSIAAPSPGVPSPPSGTSTPALRNTAPSVASTPRASTPGTRTGPTSATGAKSSPDVASAAKGTASPASDVGAFAQARIGAPRDDRARQAAASAYDRGRLRLDRHDWGAAEAAFREALSYDGSVAAYHAGLGEVLLIAERWADAEAEFSAAMLLDVDNAEYRARLKYARSRK